MLDRIIGRLKIEASGKNGLFGSLQTHCDIVTHLLTKLQPIIEINVYLFIISLYVLNQTKFIVPSYKKSTSNTIWPSVYLSISIKLYLIKIYNKLPLFSKLWKHCTQEPFHHNHSDRLLQEIKNMNR